MKALVVVAAFLALGTVAVAKPMPVSDLTREDDFAPAIARLGDVNTGPRDTSPERAYFQAPQPRFNSGGLACQMRWNVVFDKTLMTQSCN